MAYHVTIQRPGMPGLIAKSEAGQTLAGVLRGAGTPADLPCGGRGACGRCRVKAGGALAPPDAAEAALLGAAALAAGWRLACRCAVAGDAWVLSPLGEGLGQYAAGQAIEGIAPMYKGWGAAVDIGTTTLCAQLYGKGGLAGQATRKNPQAAFGADVITRIEKTLAGEGEALAASVRGALADMLAELAGGAGIAPEDIDALVVTGNTTMLHLLCGHSPKALSHAPFAAEHLYGDTVPAEALGLPARPGALVYLPRCVSAFVGADITTAVLASGMLRAEGPALLMDIGTNGELALWHNGRLRCCSTAAGPAFEGVGIRHGVYGVPGAIDRVWAEDGRVCYGTIGGLPPVGLCGSGIVDALATLLATGAVDETGAFDDEAGGAALRPGEDGLPEYVLGGGVTVAARDVRSIQLAKGSVRAGVETLCKTGGVNAEALRTLYIAGGFGSYLNIHSAAAIGLVPPAAVPVARVLGNAALAGAAMLLQNAPLAAESRALAEAAETVALDGNPTFTALYMEHMAFDA